MGHAAAVATTHCACVCVCLCLYNKIVLHVLRRGGVGKVPGVKEVYLEMPGVSCGAWLAAASQQPG
jgi:hypothetical protein